MRRAARVDASHAAIVSILRHVGCQVFDASRMGGGFPDLVVRVPLRADLRPDHLPRVVLMEVKTETGTLKPVQQEFLRDWPETVVVRSVADALLAIGLRGIQ